MHDIYKVFIDIIRSKCSIINNGWGFVRLEKASPADGLETVGSEIYPRQPGGLQRPYPSALSDLPQDGILLPAFVDDHDR